ncbi:MAG TPA: hypothetical protein EYP19_05475 [Desulfobacterales bacterium]|nr:hypothetical protein [Desulfobacterales bacterium]
MYVRVADIVTIVRELRPDLLVIDGAYLLRMPERKTGSRWEQQLIIMEHIKHLALQEDIPIIGTYQFNRRNPNRLDGLAGTYAISQLASIVISFEYERREDIDNPAPVQYRLLKLLKGRDGESGVIRVLYNMNRSIITQESVVSGIRYLEEDDDPPYERDENPYDDI